MSDTGTTKTHPEEVTAAQILEKVGKVGPGTWTQERGLHLAIGVGVVAFIIVLVILVNWVLMRPSVPNLSPTLTAEQAQSAVNNYKALSVEARDTAVQLFDAFVIRALLPVFTSILGFIFGVQTTADRKS